MRRWHPRRRDRILSRLPTGSRPVLARSIVGDSVCTAMRLRTRFCLVLVVFAAGTVLAATVLARFVLARAATRTDEARARGLLERGRSVLAEETEGLSGTARDWASGDDIYAFMAERGSRFRDANLVEGALGRLRVHAIACYDTNRAWVASVAMDSSGRKTEALPSGLRDLIERADGVLERAAGGELSGFASNRGEIWLVAVAPILTSHGEGPARGSLAVARLLDGPHRDRLSRLVDPSFGLSPAARGWPMGHMDVRRAGLRHLQAGVAIADIFGNGRLALELSVPRAAFGQVSVSVLYLTGWIVACGVGMGLLSVWLLDRWVWRNVTEAIEALRGGLRAVGTARPSRLSPPRSRNDEMGELLRAVEAAIARVEASAIEADRRREEAIHAQRLAALGTLVAGVAHEVNNPNGVMNLNLHVLQRGLDRLFARIGRGNALGGEGDGSDVARIEKELNETVAEALAASERIAGIVSSLKSFAQPGAGEAGEDIEASALIGEAARWLRDEFGKARCRLESDIAADLPHGVGNRQQLLQVFINLLQNACQATERPDSVVRVVARCDAETGAVVVTVADEGRGIPQKDLDRVFDPFFTSRRALGGMGLGLSISAAIVQAHGGTLRIESRENAGTVVTVVLPIRKGPLHAA